MKTDINITLNSDELDMICCALDTHVDDVIDLCNRRFNGEEDDSVRELKELRERMYDLLHNVMEEEKLIGKGSNNDK